MEVTFQNPDFLWLAMALPVVIIIHFYSLRFTRRKAMLFANFDAIRRAAAGVYGGANISKNLIILFLNLMIVLLLTTAAAQTTLWYEGPSSDFDFVFAIDASGSMQADESPPRRLTSANEAAPEFLSDINERTDVAVMSFSGVATVQQRLDPSVERARRAIDTIDTQYASGTAIGQAIMTATNLFEDSEQARVIILLTDGQNTVGIPLDQAIGYANENQVTIHTMGVATEQGGSFGDLISRIDEGSLQRIAEQTGGRFFRVREKADLHQALQEISSNTIGRIPIHIGSIATTLAVLLLLFEFALLNTRFRSIP